MLGLNIHPKRPYGARRENGNRTACQGRLEESFLSSSIPRSSNGRTAAFGAENRGSNPCRGAKPRLINRLAGPIDFVYRMRCTIDRGANPLPTSFRILCRNPEPYFCPRQTYGPELRMRSEE